MSESKPNSFAPFPVHGAFSSDLKYKSCGFPLLFCRGTEGAKNDFCFCAEIKNLDALLSVPLLYRVKQRVGLLYLQGGDYHSACQQILDGQMDPREVISLIPGLLLEGSSYELVHKDCEIVRGRMQQETDPEKIINFKNFLITYLDTVRTEAVASNLKVFLNLCCSITKVSPQS